MEHRLMPDFLDMREITFTNLLLLGFEPKVYEAKYNFPFNRDMFAFPNKKAMEAAFYFLFGKLNPDVAQNEFRISEYSKEIKDSHVPRVLGSLLLSPGGDKFYHLLFYFSSYVLKESLKKCAEKGTIIPPWPSSTSAATKSLLPELSKVFQTKTACEMKSFLEHAKLATQAQDEWILYAGELTKENRAIRKNNRELEKTLKELEAEHLRRGLLSPAPARFQQSSPYAGEVKSLKRTKIIQRVRDNWKHFDEVYQSQKHLREKINEILNGNSDKYCLKASDIDVTDSPIPYQDCSIPYKDSPIPYRDNPIPYKDSLIPYKDSPVPDVIIRDCDEEIYQRRIANTYEGGKVNILSLVQLWNLSLRLLLDQFKKHPLPKLDKDADYVHKELHTQSGYLVTRKSLNEILKKEMIPDLKESIEDLKEVINDRELLGSQQTPKGTTNFDFSLIGLPATPSVRLKTSKEDEDNDFATFTQEMFPHQDLPTPEVVERTMQSLRDLTLAKFDEKVLPEEKPAKKESSSIPQRIPVKKPKSVMKQPKSKARPDSKKDDNFKKPKLPANVSPNRYATPLSQKSKNPNMLISSDVSEQKPPSQQSVRPRVYTQKRAEKAQDILADKIVSSVLSHQIPSSSSSSSSSSRCATPQEHGLEDPLAAITEDAFQTKDKLPRTPHIKFADMDVSNPKRSSFGVLQSYLSVSSGNDEATSPYQPVRLFSDSFTDNSPAAARDTPPSHHVTADSTRLRGDVYDETANDDDTLTDDKDELVKSAAIDASSSPAETEYKVAKKEGLDDIINRYRMLKSKSKSIDLRVLGAAGGSDGGSMRIETPKRGQNDETPKRGQNLDAAQLHQKGDNDLFQVSQFGQENGLLDTSRSNTNGDLGLWNTKTPDAGADLSLFNSPAATTFGNTGRVSERKVDADDLFGTGLFTSTTDSLISGIDLVQAPKDNGDVGISLLQTPKGGKSKEDGLFDTPTNEIDTIEASASYQGRQMDRDTVDSGFDYVRGETKVDDVRGGGERESSKHGLVDLGGDKFEETGVRDHFSFLERTKDSAKKDAMLWSDLKANMSMDLNSEAENGDFNDEVPVAKQLSFLQIDTRDLPRTPENVRDLTRMRAGGSVQDDEGDDDLDLLASGSALRRRLWMLTENNDALNEMSFGFQGDYVYSNFHLSKDRLIVIGI
eukprot:gene9791-10790_t